MILKLEKNAKKTRKTHGKSKSNTSKLKKNGSKINGEKKERQKGKKMELAICIFFAFILLSRFAFILLLFCFLPEKNKKTK